MVPLQDDPRTTFLPPKVKEKLIKLSKQPEVKVALVSGRNLSTLKRLTKIRSKNISLVGSHGLEAYINGKNTFLFSSNKQAMKKVKAKAVKLAKSIAGGFVETKPYSFTYHIRDSRKKDFVAEIYNEVKKLIKKEGYGKKLKVLPGKLMVEILPEGVNKGKAVEKLIKKNPKSKYICFGDDVTDVYAFKMVRKYKGLAVSLNKKLDFKADLYLKSPKEVHKLLDSLLVITTTT